MFTVTDTSRYMTNSRTGKAWPEPIWLARHATEFERECQKLQKVKTLLCLKKEKRNFLSNSHDF